MDIIFQPQRGERFIIEVGFFDTVLEIKEKVQKYQGIPISKQTLIFKGQVLPDDRDIEQSELLHNSVIQLLTSPLSDADKPQLKNTKTQIPKKIHLKINMSTSKTHLPPLEMDVNDTILRVKEKIHENKDSIPVNRLVIQSNGVELQEQRSLKDCKLQDNSEIDVNIRSLPTVPRGIMMGLNNKKLKLWAMTACGTKRIPVEMNPLDNVAELRKELQNLNQGHNFILPQEQFFFIHKQYVMDEDRSFWWHRVCQDDVIEMFNGRITRAS